MSKHNPCEFCRRSPEEKSTIACKACTASNALRDIQATLYAFIGEEVTPEYNCPYEEEPDEQSCDIRD